MRGVVPIRQLFSKASVHPLLVPIVIVLEHIRFPHVLMDSYEWTSNGSAAAAAVVAETSD